MPRHPGTDPTTVGILLGIMVTDIWVKAELEELEEAVAALEQRMVGWRRDLERAELTGRRKAQEHVQQHVEDVQEHVAHAIDPVVEPPLEPHLQTAEAGVDPHLST